MFVLPEVKLTVQEMYYTANVGLSRWLESRMSDRKQNPKIGLENDIIGAIGECGFAKATGMYWARHVRSFKAPDVADIQVRATILKHGSLIYRPERFRPKHGDNPDEAYVLAIHYPPYQRDKNEELTVKIVGWLYGHECDKEEWLYSPQKDPCFMAPQSALKPMDEL